MSRPWRRPGILPQRCVTHRSCGAAARSTLFPATFETLTVSAGSWVVRLGRAMSWPRLIGGWQGALGPLWISTSTSRGRENGLVMDGTPQEPGRGRAIPPYSEVFKTRGYLALFLAAALSTWGDYLARVVVAAFVLDQTGSAFAAAATFAVSLLPSIFGRSLLAPISDRVPYKYVLIVAHLTRAVLVGVLILAMSMSALAQPLRGHAHGPLWMVFALLFLIELVGGPVVPSSQILMTELFSDRRLYARALGLGTMSEQINQAIGLTLGGFVVAWVGAVRGLVFDLVTFLLSALVITVVVSAKAIRGSPSAGVIGFFRDIGDGATYLFRHPVLVFLLALSLSSVWAIAAPEAVAIAYALDQSGSTRFGGLLMAAPV